MDASLADARIDRAWLSTIDETRAGVVTDLDLVRAGELDDPTLWLNLTPFAGLAQEQIYEATPERLHRFLDEVSWPSELRVPLAHPDPHHSKLAAEAVGLAQGWVWFYIAAGVLALLGLLAGRRRSRWVAVMLGGAVAAAAIAFGHLLLGRVVVADGDTLGRTVAASIAQGSEEALTAWTTPGLYAAGAMAVLGLAGTLVTAVTRPRR